MCSFLPICFSFFFSFPKTDDSWHSAPCLGSLTAANFTSARYFSGRCPFFPPIARQPVPVPVRLFSIVAQRAGGTPLLAGPRSCQRPPILIGGQPKRQFTPSNISSTHTNTRTHTAREFALFSKHTHLPALPSRLVLPTRPLHNPHRLRGHETWFVHREEALRASKEKKRERLREREKRDTKVQRYCSTEYKQTKEALVRYRQTDRQGAFRLVVVAVDFVPVPDHHLVSRDPSAALTGQPSWLNQPIPIIPPILVQNQCSPHGTLYATRCCCTLGTGNVAARVSSFY